jgi:ribosome-associated protein
VVKAVEEKMKELGFRPISTEGLNGTGWAILDYGDVVAHFFTEDSRRYYNLERLWADGRVIAWEPAGAART